MNRRNFLQGTAAATIVVIGTTAWYADERGAFSAGTGPAFQPWRDWNKITTGPLALVGAAILAASPHNTQPWLFRISPNTIDIYADVRRNTGALDPFLREMHIGLGCAIENMLIAAPKAGYQAQVDYAAGTLGLAPPGTPEQLVASVHLTAAASPVAPDPLYRFLPHRHTNRTDYELRPVPGEFLAQLQQISGPHAATRLFVFDGTAEKKAIVDLVSGSDRTVYASKQVDAGTIPWERVFSWRDVETYRDGITLADYGVPPLTAAWLKCLPAVLVKRIAGNQPKDAYQKQLAASAMFGIICVKDRYDRPLCLQAGRLWERAHLLATQQGIAARPINEAVELIDLDDAAGRRPETVAPIAALTGDAAWQPTFMFRMGYATRKAPASPRRGLAQVLIAALPA